MAKYGYIVLLLLSFLVSCSKEDLPDTVDVTGVVLDVEDIKLNIGDSIRLNAVVVPQNATNKKVSWLSSNENVAVVNSEGVVMALAEGTATIVVVTEDQGKYATCKITCGEGGEIGVPVDSLYLNKTELLLQQGGSFKLEATILPADATNKKVSWHSSDVSVASVDENGLVEANRVGTATVIATSEDGGKVADCIVRVFEPSLYKRTVLVYIAADNNLSSFALQDLAEMKEGMAQVSDGTLHLLVYIDTGSSPRLVELKKQNGQVVEDVVRTYDDRNSVGVDETLEVFDAVFTNPDFLAESYGLIYWSHADGWIPYGEVSTRWVGQDKTDGDHRMNLSELVTVLQSAPHLDFLMFDACFMASVEVAYEVRSFADYYIASPTETPGPGAPYQVLVPLMAADQAAVQMGQAYCDYYAANYNGGIGISNSNWTGGASLCVMRTDALEALAALTTQLLPAEVVDIASLKKAVFDYDHDGWGRDYVGYFDLKQLMEQVLDDASYATWTQAFDAAIAYWSTTPKNYSQFVGMFSMEGANGITHYIPGSSTQRDVAYRSLQWYQDAGLEKLGW